MSIKWLKDPLTIEERMAAFEVERKLDLRGWVDKIPAIRFPSNWFVQVIPGFGGALARFRVTLSASEQEGDPVVSVYLDGFGTMGCMPEPYWEIYPYDGDVSRYDMDDVDGLLAGIAESLKQQKEGSDG